VNTIAVQVDANPQEGWWYEGAGLYRHAWLVKRNQVHIETDERWNKGWVAGAATLEAAEKLMFFIRARLVGP